MVTNPSDDDHATKKQTTTKKKTKILLPIMQQCRQYSQSLDISPFIGPVPWVALYAAAASSAVCALAMTYDAISAIRRRQLWFPSSLVSLNATSLTILAVATMLSVDLSSPMPSRFDQLAKLSGSALLATAIANGLTSLASAPSSASTVLNLIALAMLVLTVAINISIQIGTGLIYSFAPEHLAVLVLTLALFLVLCSSALAVPTIKRSLERQFDDKFSLAYDTDCGRNLDIPSLKESVNRYWLMAHTASPQYVLGRSATCTASGAFGLLTCVILVEAAVRSFVRSFCKGHSGYKWSTTVVFVCQLVAVLVGTVGPASRWFNAVSFGGLYLKIWSWREELKAERYWTQMLLDWKEDASLTSLYGGSSETTHKLKNFALDLLTRAQIGVVVACKVVRSASLLPLSLIRRRYKRWSTTCGLPCIPSFSEGGANKSGASALKQYVLHLEGEEGMVDLMMRNACHHTKRFIQEGSKNQPAHLVKLMEYYSTQGFHSVSEFDSGSIIPYLVPEEPPHCWILPVVTLTTVALTLPSLEADLIEPLRRGVKEGLRYVRLVEKHLDGRGLCNTRKAADTLWLGVDRHRKWLNVDLLELASKNSSGKKNIEKLAQISKECIMNFAKEQASDGSEDRRSMHEWPAEVFASNCMYRVSRTILQGYDDKYGTDEELFRWLRTTISDILCACLTNLPRVIFVQCVCSSIETREKRVMEAALLLGEAKGMLELLGRPDLVCSYPERRQYIDDWRQIRQNQKASAGDSALTSSSTHSLLIRGPSDDLV